MSCPTWDVKYCLFTKIFLWIFTPVIVEVWWWTSKVGFDLASTVIKTLKGQGCSLDSVII
jgi:hypothetical protein